MVLVKRPLQRVEFLALSQSLYGHQIGAVRLHR
jgi:hypothetical protein